MYRPLYLHKAKLESILISSYPRDYKEVYCMVLSCGLHPALLNVALSNAYLGLVSCGPLYVFAS